MFNFLKGNKAGLTVTLDRLDGIYSPGETVGITVDIQPDKDLKLQGAQVALSGTEEFEYSTSTYTTDSDGNSSRDYSTSWGSNQFSVSTEDFLGATTLPAGAPQRYTFQLSLPADAAPSYSGDIVRVHWQASVKMDRRLAADLNADAKLYVRSLAPGVNVQPGQYGESDDPGEAEMTFTLPGLETTAGQSLSGQLHLIPHKDFAAKVRLELVRYEHTYSDEGGLKEKNYPLNLGGSTQFTAGQPQAIPFQVSIPPDAAPSLETPHCAVTWAIRGILDRPLRKDVIVEQKFEVYQA